MYGIIGIIIGAILGVFTECKTRKSVSAPQGEDLFGTFSNEGEFVMDHAPETIKCEWCNREHNLIFRGCTAPHPSHMVKVTVYYANFWQATQARFGSFPQNEVEYKEEVTFTSYNLDKEMIFGVFNHEYGVPFDWRLPKGYGHFVAVTQDIEVLGVDDMVETMRSMSVGDIIRVESVPQYDHAQKVVVAWFRVEGMGWAKLHNPVLVMVGSFSEPNTQWDDDPNEPF